jgi:hypothetical protein
VAYISGARYGGNFVLPAPPANDSEEDAGTQSGTVMGTRGTQTA